MISQYKTFICEFFVLCLYYYSDDTKCKHPLRTLKCFLWKKGSTQISTWGRMVWFFRLSLLYLLWESECALWYLHSLLLSICALCSNESSSHVGCKWRRKKKKEKKTNHAEISFPNPLTDLNTMLIIWNTAIDHQNDESHVPTPSHWATQSGKLFPPCLRPAFFYQNPIMYLLSF